MMQWLLMALCMTVIIVAFVFGWAALVVGARYDEHNESEGRVPNESSDVTR